MQLLKCCVYVLLLPFIMSLHASEEEVFNPFPLERALLRRTNDPFLVKREIEKDPLAIEEDDIFVFGQGSQQKEDVVDESDVIVEGFFQDPESQSDHESIHYEEYGLDKNAWLGAKFPLKEQKRLLEALERLQKAESFLAEALNGPEESKKTTYVTVREKRKSTTQKNSPKRSQRIKNITGTKKASN